MVLTWEPGDDERRRLKAPTTDDERRRLFAEHPELARPRTVRWACREVGRLLASELEGADNLSRTALWLARDLGDDDGLARCRRAVANIQFNRRDYLASAESLAVAVAAFDRLGNEMEAAITRNNAVVSLSQLGQHELALEYAAAARRTFERAGDELRQARLENNVAHLLSRQDRFPEALEHFRRAHSLLGKIGEPSDVATVLRNIAICYQDLNDLARSVDAYERARGYCREHGLSRILLEIDYNIAYLYYLRGEYTRSISLFEAARRQSQSHHDWHFMALCDLDQAEVFLELNLITDAARMAERAIDGFAKLGMNYEVAKALAFAALAADRLGDERRARRLLERSRPLFAAEGNRVWTAMIDLYAASSRYAAGRPLEARELATTALTSFERAAIPSRTALCEILLARLALERDDWDEARRLAAAAVERATAVGRPILELQAHLVSGQVEETSGDRAAALAAYRRAESALERMRGQLATDELKIAFGDDKQAVYEGLVAIALEGGRPDQEKTAFEYVERAKSRSLADLLAVGASELRPADPGIGELDSRIRELRQELGWLYRQLDAEELKGDERSVGTVVRLLGECRRREESLLRHQRRLLNADAELGSLSGAKVAGVEEVVEVLPEGGALLEYYVVRGLVYAFLLDRRGLRVRPVALLSDVRDLQLQLGFQFEKFQLGAGYARQLGRFLEQSTTVLLRRLHDELVAPIADELDAEHLVIVPHDRLHHLPFHALHDGERYLLDRYVVSYAPSATVFRLCCLKPRCTASRSLVLGVPDKRAPLIRDEVEAVQRLLPDARLLVGDEATPEALARLGADCRIIHLATHGLYRKDNPMFSAIQMGGSRLSLMDLYGFRLDADLAVLSGCGTGLSTVSGADELVGLTRGLLYAGARAVVATMWDVNDESTARFMKTFYRHLLDSGRTAEALRAAQLELRDVFPHPYYWAPFFLVGRPQPGSRQSA